MALATQISAAFRKVNTALAAIWADKQDVLGYVPEDVAAKNQPNGYPGLTGDGVLSTAVLPALALTATFEVADEAAMLALVAQPGDVAIRQDQNRTYIMAAEPASELASWKWLKTPTDLVLAVAGLTGTITAAALKTAIGMPIKATAAVLRALTNDADYLTAKSVADAAALVPLVDAPTIAIDLALGSNFEVTLGGNRTLGAPANAKPGVPFSVLIKQPATGGPFNLAYHPNLMPFGVTPSVSTTPGAVDLLTGFPETVAKIRFTLVRGGAA
ncbi:hypothetical protein [uncultured Brevundimonas sp.]|uniref:hypothetical protein n=1 Tax=uncultured Brevundimonas sp. TaxID=213418 RepID=UPI002616D52B|nr:hypothetical protein [uncultured Brevundimonas sp.]